MRLKELNDNIYEIDGKDIYYSFGRKLLEESIPEDNVMLLLDPLFLTIFIDNLTQLLKYGINNITILFIPFDNLSIDAVDKYFLRLEEAMALLTTYKDCKINFITPPDLEIIYKDGTFFKLQNPMFIKIINAYELEYSNLLEEGRKNV